MKKFVLPIIIISILSCSKDDDSTSQCLICDSSEGLEITRNELSNLCVGVSGEDPDTGETMTLTREMLNSYATIFNTFGALTGSNPNCRVE